MSNQEVTLKSATDAYLEHLAGSGTKPSSIAVYSKALDLAIENFGADRMVGSITVAQVGKYYSGPLVNILPSGKPKADPTVKQIKRVFRQCLEYAQTQGWVATLQVPKSELQHARQKKAAGDVNPAEAPQEEGTANQETPEAVQTQEN